jgi:hypothetical protein
MNLERHRESLKYDDTYARYAYVTKEDLELLNHPNFYKDLGISPSSSSDEDESEKEPEEGKPE